MILETLWHDRNFGPNRGLRFADSQSVVETVADNPSSTEPDAEATDQAEAPNVKATASKRSAIRGQLALTVFAMLVVGFALGRIDTGNLLGLICVGVGVLVAGALGITWTWAIIAEPIRKFADQLDQLVQIAERSRVRDLPTDRPDEVGRMAAAVRSLVIDRIRDHHDARQLRRTLDHQVSEATRKAVNGLSKLAMRDALTDLGNRRFLDAHLPGLIQAAKDSDTDLLCVTIDLDNFKQVNDTAGHAKGDELLVLVADLIKSTIRHHGDLAMRLGGDEFVVFMPGATLDRAAQLIEHTRQLFRRQAGSLLGPGFAVDLSAGAASLRQERCRDGEELMERADQYLYKAKRSGKGVTWTMAGLAAA